MQTYELGAVEKLINPTTNSAVYGTEMKSKYSVIFYLIISS